MKRSLKSDLFGRHAPKHLESGVHIKLDARHQNFKIEPGVQTFFDNRLHWSQAEEAESAIRSAMQLPTASKKRLPTHICHGTDYLDMPNMTVISKEPRRFSKGCFNGHVSN